MVGRVEKKGILNLGENNIYTFQACTYSKIIDLTDMHLVGQGLLCL